MGRQTVYKFKIHHILPLVLLCIQQSFGSTCFSMSRGPVKSALGPAISMGKTEPVIESSQGGEKKWVAARKLVPTGIEIILEWLKDHKNWKDMSRVSLSVKTDNIAGYFQHDMVSVDLHVFAFISVSWVEEWGYQLLSGTLSKPKDILVSYQKTEGTSHLPHLCGSVRLRRHNSGTDVYFYEEAISDRYQVENIRQMHLANFAILTKLSAKKQ